MPELPEVETVKRGLEKQLPGQIIKNVYVSGKRLRADYPKDIEKKLKGRKITGLRRRSKYLLIDLDDENILIIHLGMSGKILMKNSSVKAGIHDHLILELKQGGAMVFNDPRRFGLVSIVKADKINEHKLFKDLGIEPLENDFNGRYLKRVFKGKKQSVKQALMDARNLVGVGNIYASEALFRSGISPKKPAGTIKPAALEDLSKNIKKVLLEAIESGGSTLRDYVRSDGDIGYFQHSFRVYGRENQPCFKCKAKLKRIVQQGRSTFYCPACQK